MEDRVKKAVELFKQGHNCSQSVVVAFADLYDIDRETALKMSASFGGGIGRMRETCGAACGMFLLAGFEDCAIVADDNKRKSNNYHIVQQLAAEFVKRNGAMKCAELLGLDKSEKITSQAGERTPEYYKKRPCTAIVEDAARIYAEYLESVDKTI